MEQIAAFYLTDFPAWVRAQMAPGEPYIAVHADGRIIARTHDLRADGLRLGETLERAQSLFPHGNYYAHDPGLDGAIWEDVLYLIADIAPQLEAIAPGWALATPWDEAAFVELARTLGARVGFGPRRTVARIAALQAEPGGIRRVEAATTRAFLDRTTTRHLLELGVELEMIERLELFGLYTIGRVTRLERRHLDAQFGDPGVALYRLLHPEGEEPAVAMFQPPPSVAASFDFEYAASEPRDLLPVVDLLVDQTLERLGSLRAQLLTLRLHGEGEEGVRLMRRVLKAPTARAAHLRVIAKRLLDDMLDGETIDAVTLELGGLVQPTATQGGLFADRPAVYDSVRALHQRFPGRVFRAIIIDVDAYLPEEGVRMKPYPIQAEKRKKAESNALRPTKHADRPTPAPAGNRGTGGSGPAGGWGPAPQGWGRP